MNSKTVKYYNYILDDLESLFDVKNDNSLSKASKLLHFTNYNVRKYLEKTYGINLKYFFDDDKIIVDILEDWFYKNYRDGNFPRVGEKIVLISMDDPYAIKPGSIGTIITYPMTVFNEDQVDVNWDNGRSLSLIIDIDKFNKI